MNVIIWSVGTYVSIVMHVVGWLCVLDTDIEDRVDTLETTQPITIRSFVRVPV